MSRDFQGMGLANILQKKLAKAARDNGVNGLVAYTSPENRKMIKLFKKLPFNIHTEKDDDMIILNCLFTEPKQEEPIK